MALNLANLFIVI